MIVVVCHMILLSTPSPPHTFREFMLNDVKMKIVLMDCGVLAL